MQSHKHKDAWGITDEGTLRINLVCLHFSLPHIYSFNLSITATQETSFLDFRQHTLLDLFSPWITLDKRVLQNWVKQKAKTADTKLRFIINLRWIKITWKSTADLRCCKRIMLVLYSSKECMVPLAAITLSAHRICGTWPYNTHDHQISPFTSMEHFHPGPWGGILFHGIGTNAPTAAWWFWTCTELTWAIIFWPRSRQSVTTYTLINMKMFKIWPQRSKTIFRNSIHSK